MSPRCDECAVSASNGDPGVIEVSEVVAGYSSAADSSDVWTGILLACKRAARYGTSHLDHYPSQGGVRDNLVLGRSLRSRIPNLREQCPKAKDSPSLGPPSSGSFSDQWDDFVHPQWIARRVYKEETVIVKGHMGEAMNNIMLGCVYG